MKKLLMSFLCLLVTASHLLAGAGTPYQGYAYTNAVQSNDVLLFVVYLGGPQGGTNYTTRDITFGNLIQSPLFSNYIVSFVQGAPGAVALLNSNNTFTANNTILGTKNGQVWGPSWRMGTTNKYTEPDIYSFTNGQPYIYSATGFSNKEEGNFLNFFPPNAPGNWQPKLLGPLPGHANTVWVVTGVGNAPYSFTGTNNFVDANTISFMDDTPTHYGTIDSGGQIDVPTGANGAQGVTFVNTGDLTNSFYATIEGGSFDGYDFWGLFNAGNLNTGAPVGVDGGTPYNTLFLLHDGTVALGQNGLTNFNLATIPVWSPISANATVFAHGNTNLPTSPAFSTQMPLTITETNTYTYTNGDSIISSPAGFATKTIGTTLFFGGYTPTIMGIIGTNAWVDTYAPGNASNVTNNNFTPPNEADLDLNGLVKAGVTSGGSSFIKSGTTTGLLFMNKDVAPSNSFYVNIQNDADGNQAFMINSVGLPQLAGSGGSYVQAQGAPYNSLAMRHDGEVDVQYGLTNFGTNSVHVNTPLTIAGGATMRSGNGTPNSSVNGNIGDIYLNTGGGVTNTLWVKEIGAGTTTGWINK